MKTLVRILVLVSAFTTLPAWGSLIVALEPVNGIVSGLPGATVGWGATFTTDDDNHYLVSMVEFCSGAAIPNTGTCNNTSQGAFTDFAAGINGLIIGPLFSPSGYSESFNATSQTGLGSFTIDPAAMPQHLSGAIYIYYDVYEGDPFNGGIQQPSGYVFQTAEVRIEQVSSVPEPASGLLIVLSAVGMRWRRRRA